MFLFGGPKELLKKFRGGPRNFFQAGKPFNPGKKKIWGARKNPPGEKKGISPKNRVFFFFGGGAPKKNPPTRAPLCPEKTGGGKKKPGLKKSFF